MKLSVKANAILNFLKTTILLIFPLITFPYISRILGVELLGRYNYSYSIVSYFILFAGLGISTYAVREGSKIRDNKQLFQEFATEIFSINFYSSLLSFVLLYLSMFFIKELCLYKFEIIILSFEVIIVFLNLDWLFSIFEDFFVITIRSIVINIISVILIFIFVKSRDDLLVYLSIVSFTKVITNVYNYYFSRKIIKLHISFRLRLKKHIKPILIIFSTSIAITIYMNSDITMLGLLTNDYYVGLYSMASKIYSIFKNLLVSILVVMIPRFSILSEKNDNAELCKYFKKVFNILLTLLFPSILGMIFFSKEVIMFIGGVDYVNSVFTFQILLIAAIFSLFSYLYTQCIIIPMRMEKYFFIATIISACVNLLLNFLLIPIWQDKAAAFTTLISEIIVFLIMYFISQKKVKIKNNLKYILYIFFGSILVLSVCVLIKKFFNNDSLVFLLSVFSSICVYIFYLFFTKNKYFFDFFKSMKKKRCQ